MYLRYSSNVVAPTHCNSPRASSGLIIDERSSEPSAAPAPTSVCSSSMNRMTSRAARLTSSRMRLTRPSNSPRYFVPATSGPRESARTRLSRSAAGTSPRDDALREAFDDRGLADAGLADEDRIVLAAPREDRDDAFDLASRPMTGSSFPFASDRGEIARIGRERRRPAAQALAEIVERRRRAPSPCIFSARRALPAMSPAAARAAPTNGSALVGRALLGAGACRGGGRRRTSTAGLPASFGNQMIIAAIYQARRPGVSPPRVRPMKTTVTDDGHVDVRLVELRRRRAAATRAIDQAPGPANSPPNSYS